MVSKKIAPWVAAALLVTSTVATAQAASPPGAGALSVAAAMQSSGEEAGSSAGIGATLLPIFLVVAVALVAIASKDNGDDEPSSP